MVNITVCGYPRSGSVWICRLFGEALDVRVVGIKYGKGSLAAEGFERRNDGYVRQAHLWPGKNGHLRVDLSKRKDEIFLHMVRDPRDIAVSAAYFWDWTIDEALGKMIDGPGPLELPTWNIYVESWFAQHVPTLRYEDFHENTEYELGRVLKFLKLEPKKDLAEVVENQSFAIKRAELEKRGNRYPFKRTAQLKHMRNGNVGEWKEALSVDQKRATMNTWRLLLKKLDYYEEEWNGYF